MDLEKRLDRALAAGDRADAAQSSDIAMKLSRGLSYRDRARFVAFAKRATIGHWAEVIEAMENELRREGRDPKTGGR